MRVEFRGSFARDLKKVRDRDLLTQVRSVIETVERASSLQEVDGVKKLRGGEEYYRIRVGEYRVGIALDGDAVIFVRCLHRRDVYRYFP